MEMWRNVWRKGFAPNLSTTALNALATALRHDDPGLLQGCTTTPPPLLCVQDFKCEGGCAVAFCGWKGERLETVGEVEEYFAKLCFEANESLGATYDVGCRWFLNWFDDTPRPEMRRELLAEVELELSRRANAVAGIPATELAGAAA